MIYPILGVAILILCFVWMATHIEDKPKRSPLEEQAAETRRLVEEIVENMESK